MKREDLFNLLRKHKPTLADRFGAIEPALFASDARDNAEEGSDVDILALFRFDGPATSQRYFGVQFYIEDLLGRPVDLATSKALRKELRTRVEREAIGV